MRRLVNVKALLRDLQTGHGAQRLPPALRGIQIEGIRTSGARASHRQLVKQVLPRMKYNNEKVQIDVVWDTRKASNRKRAGEGGVMQAIEADKIVPMPVKARFLFDALPTQEITLDDKPVTELTQQIMQLIRSATGQTVEEVQPTAPETVGKPARKTNADPATQDEVEHSIKERTEKDEERKDEVRIPASATYEDMPGSSAGSKVI